MAAKTAKGPFKLVTVNTAPERAFRLVGRVGEQVKEDYIIKHVANCERIEDVKPTVEKEQPDVLFCASMWSADEAAKIQGIAREVKPNIVTYAIPHGLQVERGPDAIVEHLCEKVPGILDSVPSQ